MQLIATYGLLVVLVSVFVDQGGIPIPAYPAIIVTTASIPFTIVIRYP